MLEEERGVRLGSSSVYAGQSGRDYYNWQRQIGEVGAALNAWKFVGHIQPTDTVVDFGCGGGALLASLDCAVRVAVEPNPVARADAKLRGIRVVESAAELPTGEADLVISNHVLEHVLNPLDQLRELRRSMKRGGKIVLVVPSEHASRAYRSGDIDHHLYTWTPLLLGNLLGEAGFQRVEAHLVRLAWRPQYRHLLRFPLVFKAVGAVTALALDGRQIIAVGYA